MFRQRPFKNADCLLQQIASVKVYQAGILAVYRSGAILAGRHVDIIVHDRRTGPDWHFITRQFNHLHLLETFANSQNGNSEPNGISGVGSGSGLGGVGVTGEPDRTLYQYAAA